MENKKLGQEPAFPELSTEYDGKDNVLPYQNKGMSKRFYAACAILTGKLSSFQGMIDKPYVEYLVKESYLIADELLRQEYE